MRVTINCRSFSLKEYAGIGRYAYNLVKSLSAIDQETEYYLYLKKDFFDFRRHIPTFPAKNFKVKVDQFHLGPKRLVNRTDIYHLPSPDWIDESGGKIIVTVHDLIHRFFPAGHSNETIEIVEKQFQGVIQKAHKIICCSESTLEDLKKSYGVGHEKACRIYQGVDKSLFCPLKEGEDTRSQHILKSHGVELPFLLFVGTIEPRKNVPALLEAFAILKNKSRFWGKLVIIGKKGWQSEGVFSLIPKLHLRNDVFFLGFVPDEELRYFYALAEAFVYPSSYEGFGFPILEAMSCGCPVVTTAISSCGEIAKDAAVFADPLMAQSIAEGIKKMIESKEFKEDLRRKALLRSQDFSFQKTAQETLKIYKEVYRSGAS